MFNKVLIANRGVIAVRIIRTLKKLQIKSVCIYSIADSQSLHVALADESYCIGKDKSSSHPTDTYLNVDEIMSIAIQTKCDAIHPGYGFLSENADFAERCTKAGIIFIGPTPEQIRILGLKHTSRDLAIQNNVPVLPGSGLLRNVAHAKEEASKIGYPVMLKSVGGGGGIGMKFCKDEQTLEQEFDSVIRLATSLFKESGVYIEKFISVARHIEVQIFGDGKGNVVAIGERDCSAQRRNQKVIEESPAQGITNDIRKHMQECAIALTKAVAYQCAGTVEYVYDCTEGKFYFLEVNTRLQVEHGVTEEVFGIDLIELMIKQASRELDFSSSDTWALPSPQGHSIQVRLYAEDPNKNFQPSAGILTCATFPPSDLARIETWVETGCEIPPNYDPMISKIIVKGKDRLEAVEKLKMALGETKIYGLESNLDYLRQVVLSQDFETGNIHTRWMSSFLFHPNTIDVLEPGTQSTIQDYPGRLGYWAIGVSPSGPMDHYACRVANRLVGNEESAAVLETTLVGPKLKFNADAIIAITGNMDCEIDGKEISVWQSLQVKAGSILHMKSIQKSGCRAYLAIGGGGFDVPDYLGSKSTFYLTEFGFGGHAGRTLRHGDVLHIINKYGGSTSTTINGEMNFLSVPKGMIPQYANHWDIGVLYGPHGAPDFFTNDFMKIFFETNWKVHYNSNRLGIRLIGPKPTFTRLDGGEAGLHPSNIHDTEYAIGTINFTGDMPVILGKDGPSLGGFVCPATIIQSELWKIGQVRPGDTIRFVRSTYNSALAHELNQDDMIKTLTFKELTNTNADEKENDLGNDCILYTLEETSDHPKIVYRMAGDKNILIEYGPLLLDLKLRFRVHQLMEWISQHPLDGIIELSPGVRSLQVQYDGRVAPLKVLLQTLIDAESHLPPVENLVVKSRILHLPLAINASSTRAAIEKYRQSVRDTAPWLPSNLEFIRRINGLDSVDDVISTIFKASYMVLGLGDVYLGAPCALPIDPRHRLLTTKYNPARTWTAEGEVGIGGVFMCIYGMNSPGGYQLVGRTASVWNTYKETREFTKPWLLRFFDQVKFVPMEEDKLIEFRKMFVRGQAQLKIEEVDFSVGEHLKYLEENRKDITDFQSRQQIAFTEERDRWAMLDSASTSATAATPASSDDSTSLLSDESNEFNAENTGSLVCSQISGCVWSVKVSPKDKVKKGQTLIVIEAMKLEIPVIAPSDGIVKKIFVQKGTVCTGGDPLILLEEETFNLDTVTLDIDTLSNGYKSSVITPEQIVNVIYDRIERNTTPYAFIHLVDREKSIQRAKYLASDEGLKKLQLFGIPFAVKDNIDVEGVPTTCACPDYSYIAKETNPVVQQILDAGGIFIGKCNMDQFAAGLVGVRSPYGICSSVFSKEYVSGGSSAGSAVSVANSIVTFSLGTDTAGSGRVPASFNNIVGWKPTRGLLSTSSVVPACRSIDCITVFALSCYDVEKISHVVVQYDEKDPYSRNFKPSLGASKLSASTFKFGIPFKDQLQFFGDEEAKFLYLEAVEKMKELGGVPIEIDYTFYNNVANLLYSGPWVAERLDGIYDFYKNKKSSLHPVTATIIGNGEKYSARDVFYHYSLLEKYKRESELKWNEMDVLFLPTAGTIYKISDIENDPIQLNTNLGYYTNFVNLLDMSAIAIPAGFRDSNNLPFGVTLIGPSFYDYSLIELGAKLHKKIGGHVGATSKSVNDFKLPVVDVSKHYIDIAVVGAHLSGQPLNYQLVERGAILVKATKTASNYKLFALNFLNPPKPGLVKSSKLAGSGVDVEIYKMPSEEFGSFMKLVPSPLGIGTIQLKDDTLIKCFICEPFVLEEENIVDITSFGGWRGYLQSLSASKGEGQIGKKRHNDADSSD